MINRLLLAIAMLALLACDTADEPDRDLVARVNGEPVYAGDLEAARDRIFGEGSVLAEEGGENAARDELLESVVASRLLARRAEAAMSDTQKRQLDARARAWREEQLLMRWLRENVTPQPVTRQMVLEYYRDNPERFGAGHRYRHEALRLTTEDEDLRDRAIDALDGASAEDDWQALARRLRADGVPMDYQHGDARRGMSDEALIDRLRALEPGEAGALRMDGNSLSKVRLLSVEKTPPKPLEEVSDDIRMRLAPVQLRKAVRRVMDEALDDAEIEYIEQ